MFALEKDTVIGTFTHTAEYLPALEESIKTFYPNIEYILQFAPLPINKNFNELRKKFIATGKRYWVFMDHDIQFISSETIKIALKTMIRGRYAIVGVYSSYHKDCIQYECEMIEREVGWVPGYFQLVDSHLIGHIKADLSLPYPNIGIDTSYCVHARSEGHKVGIAKTCVYHQYKPLNLCLLDEIRIANQYFVQKWGKFYFETCSYSGCLIGPDYGREIWNLTDEQLQDEMDHEFEMASDTDNPAGLGILAHVLKEYGEKYNSITELGIQHGASTISFAMGRPKSICGYEYNDTMGVRKKALLGRYAGWKYKIADSRNIDIGETDILFIDTDHTYDQLICELSKHHGRVKHHILLHDTCNCGIIGERGYTGGLLRAINEFITAHPEWSIEKMYMDNHGLTVLKRKINEC